MDSNTHLAVTRNGLALLVAGVLVVGGSTAASASENNDIDVLGALQAADSSLTVADGKLLATSSTLSVPDAYARTTASPETSVVMPEASNGPVLLGAPGEAADLSIGLPAAQKAQPSTDEGLGVVSYDNGDGSTTVPVAGTNSVKINTIIENASAPDSYSYDIGLVDGGDLALTDLGGVAILDAQQELAYYVEAPWARDANGQDVPTSYSVADGTLTQHVDLSDPSIAFPVVADPQLVSWPAGTGIRFSQAETKTIGDNSDLAGAAAAFCGLIGSAPGAVACGIGASVVIRTKLGPIQEAAAQNRCSQVNIPYGSGPALWFTYNIAC
jgi:hypothetical protein